MTWTENIARRLLERRGYRIYPPISSVVERERARHGFSPEELGELIGVSGMTVRRIEKGKIGNPHARTKARLAHFCGMEVADIWPTS